MRDEYRVGPDTVPSSKTVLREVIQHGTSDDDTQLALDPGEMRHDTVADVMKVALTAGVKTILTSDTEGTQAIAPSSSEPSSPQEGHVYLADAANWNPLALQMGDVRPYLVLYHSGAWHHAEIMAENVVGDNLLLNGAFWHWQRSQAEAGITDAKKYVADRWMNAQQGYSPDMSNVYEASPPALFPSGVRNYCLWADSGISPGLTDFASLEQRIPLQVGKSSGTLSFQAKAAIAQELGVVFEVNYGVGGSASDLILGTPATLTSSWAQFVYHIDAPDTSGKVWGSKPYFGVRFYAAAGANLDSITGFTGGNPVSSFQINITACKMESGDIMTRFQLPIYQEERVRLMQYFQRIGHGAVAFYQSQNAEGDGKGHVVFQGLLPQIMYQPPTPVLLEGGPFEFQWHGGTVSTVGSKVQITGPELDWTADQSTLNNSYRFAIKGTLAAVTGGLPTTRDTLILDETSAVVGLDAEDYN